MARSRPCGRPGRPPHCTGPQTRESTPCAACMVGRAALGRGPSPTPLRPQTRRPVMCQAGRTSVVDWADWLHAVITEGAWWICAAGRRSPRRGVRPRARASRTAQPSGCPPGPQRQGRRRPDTPRDIRPETQHVAQVGHAIGAGSRWGTSPWPSSWRSSESPTRRRPSPIPRAGTPVSHSRSLTRRASAYGFPCLRRHRTCVL